MLVLTECFLSCPMLLHGAVGISDEVSDHFDFVVLPSLVQGPQNALGSDPIHKSLGLARFLFVNSPYHFSLSSNFFLPKNVFRHQGLNLEPLAC